MVDRGRNIQRRSSVLSVPLCSLYGYAFFFCKEGTIASIHPSSARDRKGRAAVG